MSHSIPRIPRKENCIAYGASIRQGADAEKIANPAGIETGPIVFVMWD